MENQDEKASQTKESFPSYSDRDVSIMLCEYSALKEEQSGRITLRDTALYISIVVSLTGYGMYFNVDNDSKKFVLWVVPVTTAVLFWIYYTNDLFVGRIREYVVNLGEKLGLGGQAFGWETAHREGDNERLGRRILNTVALVCAFVAPTLAALVLLDPGAGQGRLWQAGFALVCILLALVVVGILRLSDL